MLKQFRHPILVSTLSLALCLMLSSCGKKKKEDPNANASSPAPQAAAAPPVVPLADSPCSAPPVDDALINYDDYSLKNATVGENGSIGGTWLSTSYMCGHLEGEDNSRQPELALLIGNVGGTRSFEAKVGKLTTRWIGAAAASHRRGCVYVVSQENLEKLSAKENVERIVILGRGTQGGLMGAMDSNPILVKEISTFRSTELREVTFLSTQTRSRTDEWQRVFGRSHDVKLNMSKTNSTIERSYQELMRVSKGISDCRL